VARELRLRLLTMNSLHKILLLGGVVIAAGFTMIPAAPAAADSSIVQAETAPTEVQGEVTGEPWSAPAAPVTCVLTGMRVNCAPTDRSESKAERCFRDVTLGSRTRATVCTTSESNTDKIIGDGGREAILSYGCAVLDAPCSIGEGIGKAMATVIGGGISWAIGQASFNSDSRLWSAAVGEWAWWQGAIILVILGAGIWAIVAAVIGGDRSDLVSALVRFALAFPLSAASLWLVGTLLNIVDGMVKPILQRGSSGGLEQFMDNLIFGGGGGNFWLATIVLALFALATVVLVVVFSFRNFALAALIAIGPVAWMLFPTSIGTQWAIRYWSAVLALLLTTPLTLGLLSLVISGIGAVDTLWSVQALPFGIGLCLIAFTPFAAFNLFAFATTAAADAVGSRMGSGATSAARQGGHAVTSMAKSALGRSAAIRRQAARTAGSATGHLTPAGGTSGGPRTSTAGRPTPTPAPTPVPAGAAPTTAAPPRAVAARPQPGRSPS
jgi:hypothetical protein